MSSKKSLVATAKQLARDKLWNERTWPQRLTIVAVFTMATAGVCFIAANNAIHSRGERDGQITKFSEKGGPLFCYTHEGELAMQNLSTGGRFIESGPKKPGSVGNNTFAFSVESELIAKEIEKVRNIGKVRGEPVQVTLAYNQHFFPLKIWPAPCHRDTEYNIIGISYKDPDTGKFTEIKLEK